MVDMVMLTTFSQTLNFKILHLNIKIIKTLKLLTGEMGVIYEKKSQNMDCQYFQLLFSYYNK